MMSKSFLSGIFSVVSFIRISNLAIPSTFAQCPPDVSGTWVGKGVIINECYSDPSHNGVEKFNFSIQVVQVGNEISASWVEDDGESQVLTGIVNGNSVYFKVEGTRPNNPGCGWVDHAVGIIKGNRIKGYGTGGNICNTGRWHGLNTFSFKIVK